MHSCLQLCTTVRGCAALFFLSNLPSKYMELLEQQNLIQLRGLPLRCAACGNMCSVVSVWTALESFKNKVWTMGITSVLVK